MIHAPTCHRAARHGGILAAAMLLAACAAPATDTAHARGTSDFAIAAEIPGCRTIHVVRKTGTRETLICDTPWQRAQALAGSRADDSKRRHVLRPREYLRWRGDAPWHGDTLRPDFSAAFSGGLCGGAQLSGIQAPRSAVRSTHIGIDGRLWAAPPSGLLIGTAPGLGAPHLRDRACLGRVLEYIPDGGTVLWNRGPDSARPREATPLSTYRLANGRFCREFISNANAGSGARQIRARACRQPNGAWHAVS